MVEEIVRAWKEGGRPKMSEGYKCKYCGKEYRKESTLSAHLCEVKRRWQEEKEVGVQMGLQAYLRFYEMTQGSAKMKTYGDFVDSPYYRAFVKFGRHLVSIRAVNPRTFIDWVIKENKKLDHWCHEKIYLEYLQQYMKKEAVQDAVERALLEMQAYADEHKEFNNGFRDYFRYGSANRIVHHICNGRISPWIVYNCDTGIEFLDRLTEEQIGLVMPWIDPEYWQRKFKDYLADTEWVKTVLKDAGL
jgi:hypothetical protein